MKKIFIYSFALLALAACSKSGALKGDYMDAAAPGAYFEGTDGAPEGGGGDGNGNAASGLLTAGEWCDLDHWDFWSNLMTREPKQAEDPAQAVPDYASMAYSWGFNTSRRVAVLVKDAAGAPAVNVPVELLRGETVLWSARTSNEGRAELWHDLFTPKGQETSAEGLSVRIDGAVQEQPAVVTTFSAEAVALNEYVISPSKAPESKAEIAFIVDATGSMTDEILFLKQDLMSILERVRESNTNVEISTGAVFYRDEGDDYITRFSPFGTPSSTIGYIQEQYANGGGDLPEAVHAALEVALKNLSWNADARARLAFLVLDAPAHGDRPDVIKSLQESIRDFSAKGIRLIPVLASTGDKTTEFMCRDFAIVTGGTYVFLTDDSGIGGSHLTPTVGEYQVEKLNDLMFRLIEAYIK